MINLEVFLLGLLITSTLTGLVTEAVKILFTELKLTYRSNTLAGVIALLLSALIGVGYINWFDMDLNSQTIICLIAQVFLSWLCAMIGYDKVIQAISQFKIPKKEDESDE